MGVVKNILFVFLIFLSFNVKSQIVRDTVLYDGNRYVKHIVKAGESLKTIARLHNITVADILNHNETQRNLYYNQLLYIPVFDNKKEKITETNNYEQIKSKEKKINYKEKFERKKRIDIHKEIESSLNFKNKKSKFNIALLLPYFIPRNDTMFNDFKNKEEQKSLYYINSEAALSYHIGVKLAVDSLRRKGINITLYMFDTNNDSAKTQQIINSDSLDIMDIIIGPLYSKNFKLLCSKYGNDKDKILISPLSKKIHALKDYSSVYQLTPSVRVQLITISDYITKHHLNDNIIILCEENFKGRGIYLNKLFSDQNLKSYSYNITSTKVDSIRNIFGPKQVVIIPSTNKAFVSKLMGSIGSIDSTSVIFGLSAWKKYDNLDINNLMFLNTHLPNPNILESNQHDSLFIKLFINKYGNTNFPKYTYIGYNTIFHFCSEYEVFKFKTLDNEKGKINFNVPLYHYVDYELVPCK